MSAVRAPQMGAGQLERLPFGWWAGVPGGTGLVALLAFHGGVYAMWSHWITSAVSQHVFRVLLMVTLAIHVSEAIYAVRCARRAGFRTRTGVLFGRTVAVGYPSLLALRRQLAMLSVLIGMLFLMAGGAVGQMHRQHRPGVEAPPVDDLAKQLVSPNADRRLQAVKELGSSKDPKAVEYLIKALADEDVRVQAKAVQELGDMRATESTQVLLQRLVLRTTDNNMKQLIIVSLGKIGDQSAVHPLIELLHQDLDNDTRGTAIFALGELGAPESIDELDRIAQSDSDPMLRRVASEARSKIEGRRDNLPRLK